jgi:phage terminase Nu1 subunit (DNA packaging protein)
MASRGLAVSQKQCCDILSWTRAEFEKAVRDGMPVAERPSGRGTDWVVFMGDVIRWLVERELQAAGHGTEEAVPRFRAAATRRSTSSGVRYSRGRRAALGDRRGGGTFPFVCWL